MLWNLAKRCFLILKVIILLWNNFRFNLIDSSQLTSIIFTTRESIVSFISSISSSLPSLFWCCIIRTKVNLSLFVYSNNTIYFCRQESSFQNWAISNWQNPSKKIIIIYPGLTRYCVSGGSTTRCEWKDLWIGWKSSHLVRWYFQPPYHR